MKLREYLKKNKIRQAEFAAIIGVSHRGLKYYISGSYMPSREIMIEIARATDFEVTPNDFYNIGDVKNATRSRA